ncbi:MAG: tRNA (adenosine(37)-N6)-threonylcarbamoyltransferase complex ATPase subunit type 1 TsaE [Coriobacteriia bacterium]|nr:tRNA (adenosine(37)-N6)-threonylcarbamoyltransferase complex ATPase subunit type 1 TsaE [Coriobacteriia bacterium]
MPESVRTNFVLRSDSTAATAQIGRVLGALLAPGDVLLLTGDLGAGKTHLTQGIAAGLGITDAVTSPTFNLELAYESGRLPLYHFDLYRLEDEDQLEQLDFFGTIEAGGATVVEWGDRFAAVERLATVVIEIALLSGESEDARELRLRALDERGDELLTGLRARLVMERARDYVAD